MRTAVILDKGRACATIIGGGLLGFKFQDAAACTKARYIRHFIGSYLRSTNQSIKQAHLMHVT